MKREEKRPPCPRVTTLCPGHLDERSNPERFVCDRCQFVWSLTDIAILGQRKTA